MASDSPEKGGPKNKKNKAIVAEEPVKYGRGRPKKGEIRPPKPETQKKREAKIKREALKRTPDFEPGTPRAERPDKAPDDPRMRLSDLIGEEPIQTHGKMVIDPELIEAEPIDVHNVQRPPPGPNSAHEKAVKRALTMVTERQLAEILNELLFGNVNQLWEIANEAKFAVTGTAKGTWSPIQVMIARISCKIMAEGDYKAFEALITRLIGKPKQILNITGGTFGSGSRVVIQLPPNGREQKPA